MTDELDKAFAWARDEFEKMAEMKKDELDLAKVSEKYYRDGHIIPQTETSDFVPDGVPVVIEIGHQRIDALASRGMEPDMMILPPDDGQYAYEEINPGKAMVDEGLNEPASWRFEQNEPPLRNVNEDWPAPLKPGPKEPNYRNVTISVQLNLNMTALAHEDEYLPNGQVDISKIYDRIYVRVYELLEQEAIVGLRGKLVNIL